MFHHGSSLRICREARRTIARLVTVVWLPLLCTDCRQSDAATNKSGGRPPPSVVVVPVEVRDVPVEVQAPVDLRPLEQVEVGSKVLGYLDAIFVDRGDRVKKGQLIALVRPSDLPGQVAAARGSYAQIESNAALAKLNYARAQKLRPAGVLSDQEFEQSASAVASTEAAEAAAKAQLDALAVRLGETQINSPIDGYVAKRRLDPGALVGPTTTSGSLATIVRIDRLRAFINVGERDALAVVTGMAARVVLDALPDAPVVGEVVRVSPAIDADSRTVEAEVQLKNTDGKLRPGMYGRGFIRLALHRNATVVPVTAVQINSQGQSVFVVSSDQAKIRRIVLGTEVDGGAALEVVSGLQPGEQVIVAGSDGLSDGARVRSRTSQSLGAPPSTASGNAFGVPNVPSSPPAPPVASRRP
jgi:RND family efflux transporter MFP subunit